MQLTRRGWEIPLEDAAAVKRARRELRVTPFSAATGLSPAPFDVCVQTPTSLLVPPFWAREAFAGQAPHDARSPGKALAEATMRFEGALREDLCQPHAASAVLKSLKTTGGGVLCLPTGYGACCLSFV